MRMTRRALLLIALLAVTGCTSNAVQWLIWGDVPICCGGRLGWIAIPRHATFSDAQLVYEQELQVLHEVSVSYNVALKSDRSDPKHLRALRAAVVEARDSSGAMRHFLSAWAACLRTNPSYCTEGDDWRTEEAAFRATLETASRLAAHIEPSWPGWKHIL